MPKAKTNKRQNTYVIAISVIGVIASIFFTLYATGVLFGGDDSGGENSGYQNVTFTDAVITCKKATREDYGDKIQSLITDNHSSRYDGKRSLYKIFLQMDLYNKKRTKATLHYINCFVRAGNGSIRKYEVFEDVERRKTKVNDDTNMFGMPKNR